jgi:hypothetical protein
MVVPVDPDECEVHHIAEDLRNQRPKGSERDAGLFHHRFPGFSKNGFTNQSVNKSVFSVISVVK